MKRRQNGSGSLFHSLTSAVFPYLRVQFGSLQGFLRLPPLLSEGSPPAVTETEKQKPVFCVSAAKFSCCRQSVTKLN